MKTLWASLLVCTLIACTPDPAAPPPRPTAGADLDAHGCKGSAGFTWSEVRQLCIRIFEAGLAFTPDPAPSQGAVLLAFVVLAPAQGDAVTAAELFVPGHPGPLPLTRVPYTEGETRPTVLVNPDAGVRLWRVKDEHLLQVKGQLYRRSSAPDDRLFLLR